MEHPDFGPDFTDPPSVLDGWLEVYGVERVAVWFAEAVARHRMILNAAAVDELDAADLLPTVGE